MIRSVIAPAFVLILFMLMACQSNSQNSSSAVSEKAPDVAEQPVQISKVLAPADFQAKLAEVENAQLIDVRTPMEIEQGYIPNAKAMNFQDPSFKDQLATLDKSKPVFVYCAAGGRSGRAADMLKKMGFSEIYDLKGGFTQWNAQGLEAAKP